MNSKLLTTMIAVQSELAYQERETAKADRPDMVEHLSMGDYLTAMQENLDRARRAWYNDSDPYQETMHFVRKVTALGVKSGCQFGMPSREKA